MFEVGRQEEEEEEGEEEEGEEEGGGGGGGGRGRSRAEGEEEEEESNRNQLLAPRTGSRAVQRPSLVSLHVEIQQVNGNASRNCGTSRSLLYPLCHSVYLIKSNVQFVYCLWRPTLVLAETIVTPCNNCKLQYSD